MATNQESSGMTVRIKHNGRIGQLVSVSNDTEHAVALVRVAGYVNVLPALDVECVQCGDTIDHCRRSITIDA
jgi:hypothetical protein